jgi:hypothetical protein
MKLKLREIEIFYLREPFAASKEPLKASENKYRFTFSENTEALELEKRANQLMLKFIKQIINEKSFESEEDEAFYLTINNNIKQEDFATVEKILGYDINPKKVFNIIIKERDKTLSKFLKLKGVGKKDYIFVSLILTKGSVHKAYYTTSLEVVYRYDIL